MKKLNGQEELCVGKDGFGLPSDLITSTQAILARKRRGKTYTASVEAEGMLELGAQIVVFDPTGAWWGLRAGADGDPAKGYQITIFGGNHQDAVLDPTTGTAMAAAVMEHGFSAIFDMRKLQTVDRWRFMRDFAAEMLRTNERPIHLFIDEADTFAPQTTRDRMQFECLGAVTRLVKEGGIQSLGVTLITQRAASINWDVLSQIDMLTVLAMTAEVDVAPVVKWLAAETDKAFADEAKVSIPKLAVGQAIVASANFDIAQRVDIRQRQTFNSGRTVKFGEVQAKARLAPVDAAKLGAEIARAVQKAKEEDPVFLKRELEDLRAALAAKGDAPMGMAEDIAAMERELEELRPLRDELPGIQERLSKLEAELATAYRVRDEALELIDQMSERLADFRKTVSSEPLPTILPELRGVPERPSSTPKPVPSGPGAKIGKAERAILTVLAQRGESSRARIAATAGYSEKGGGFNNAVSSCRTNGWITGSDPLAITREGRTALGAYERLPTGTALLQHWQSKVGKAEREILGFLARRRKATREAIAEGTGYAASGGGFNNALSSLRTLGLIQGSKDVSLTPEFADAVSGREAA